MIFIISIDLYVHAILDGWAADKLRSRKTGIEIDYSKANMSQGSLILTGIWSAGLLLLVTRIILVQVFHQT